MQENLGIFLQNQTLIYAEKVYKAARISGPIIWKQQMCMLPLKFNMTLIKKP